MKLRINFTYTYDVNPMHFPKEFQKYPELIIQQESQHVAKIISTAIEEKKKGILLTMDILEEVSGGDA